MPLSESVRAQLQAALDGPADLKKGALDAFAGEDVAEFIRHTLGEPLEEGQYHLIIVLRYHGRVGSLNLLRRTLQIEREGGMLTTREPQRRRTIGGVYYTLDRQAQRERKRRKAEALAKAQAEAPPAEQNEVPQVATEPAASAPVPATSPPALPEPKAPAQEAKPQAAAPKAATVAPKAHGLPAKPVAAKSAPKGPKRPAPNAPPRAHKPMFANSTPKGPKGPPPKSRPSARSAKAQRTQGPEIIIRRPRTS